MPQAIERVRRCRRLSDTMPPTGSQPVRAATKTSSSEVRSGGSDSSTRDAARIGARHEAAAARAADDAERQTERRRQRQRRQREQRRVPRALGDEIADRTVVGERAAEVEAQRAASQSAYCEANGRSRP